MIQCDCRHQVFKLDTPATSYVCAIVDGGYLGHVYYGRKLEDTDLSYLLRTEEFPLVPSVNPRKRFRFWISFPLPCIGAHVSDCPNHVTGRITPFETRGIAALFGTFGYELDITRISDDERA